MDAEFWRERWRRREIGFHRASPHPALVKHWDELRVARGGRVFVPLAGKSVDMLWLRERGHPVVAVELSELAVREFFAENALDPLVEPRGPLARFEAGGIEVWCGDFFALTPRETGPFAAVYDRAALVALPPNLRVAYARRMTTLSAPGTRTLLVTLEYGGAPMQGPPFSVSEEEVGSLYGDAHSVTLLSRESPEDAARFAARGVPRVAEAAYLLERE